MTAVAAVDKIKLNNRKGYMNMKKILVVLLCLFCLMSASCRADTGTSGDLQATPAPTVETTPAPAVEYPLLTEYREFYTGEKPVAVVDLHGSRDMDKLLDHALKNYGLQFGRDDIIELGSSDYIGSPALVIPANTETKLYLGLAVPGTANEDKIAFNQPVLLYNTTYKDYYTGPDGQQCYIYYGGDSRQHDNVDMLSDKLLFAPALYTDEKAFTDKAHSIGYTDEMLKELRTGHWSNEDEFRTFVLTYGKSRLNANGHDCTGIDIKNSPDGRYTIRYSGYTWGGSYMGYAVFIEDNDTGTTIPLDKNGWFSNYETPVFLDNTHFVVSNSEQVGFYDITNPTQSANVYKLADSENYRIVSVYSNTRDGNVVIGWAHIPKDSDTVEKPTYYYHFTFTDIQGNVIKQLDSDLGVAFTVSWIAQPGFKTHDGRHPDGKLKMQLWKYGDYILDLNTGHCEKAEN